MVGFMTQTKTINEQAIAASLRFIFTMSAQMSDKASKKIDVEILKGLTPPEKAELEEALGLIQFSRLINNDDPEEFIKSNSKKRDDEDTRCFLLVAERFAIVAKNLWSANVASMAIPAEFKNHRIRQSLKRKRCPTLAALCSKID